MLTKYSFTSTGSTVKESKLFTLVAIENHLALTTAVYVITQRNHVEAHHVLIITITKLIFKLIMT